MFLVVIFSLIVLNKTTFGRQLISVGSNRVAAVIGGNFLGGGRGSVLGMPGGVLVTTLVLNIVLVFGLDVTFQMYNTAAGYYYPRRLFLVLPAGSSAMLKPAFSAREF